MSTRGAVPPNFTSPTGQFRLLANDTAYTNVAGGLGDYSLFSDDEINGYLAVSPTSLLRCVGYGYLALAAAAALQAKDVQDYDLSADLTKRSGELRSTARAFFDRADFEADLAGTDSTFGIDAPPHHHRRNILEPTEWDTLRWGEY